MSHPRTGPTGIVLTVTVTILLLGCGGTDAPEVPPLVAPELLRVEAIEDSVWLEWTAVAGATGYHLYFSLEPGVTPETGERVEGLERITFVHRSLEPGRTYHYVVAAVDQRGVGPVSDEGSATVPPEAGTIALAPSVFPEAVVERPWASRVAASGGVPPYAFRKIGGAAWVLLDEPDGLVWGRPPAGEIGPAPVEVEVSDARDVRSRAVLLVPVRTPSQDLAPIVLAEGGDASSGAFTTVDSCSRCHSNSPAADAMRDASDRSVSAVNLWSASLMADSARDPYYRAVLRAELDALPQIASLIEDTCLTCHAPMAAYLLHEREDAISLEVVYGSDAIARLALDGGSCTTCHQMTNEDLGDRFDGNLEVNPDRWIWGPHSGLFTMPMVGASGYSPARGMHVSESALCAVCHVLRTPSFAPDGTPLGTTFPEQTPYFEWQNSVFSTEVTAPSTRAASCQDCHMPTFDEDGVYIETEIARRPDGTDFPVLEAREPFGRHRLLGGNAAMLRIFRDQADDLRPRADAASFGSAIAATQSQLRMRTARLEVEDLEREEGRLSFSVRVTNLAGHKFPTSFPSRRAWLRVLLEDERGDLVFASGRVDEDGVLLDLEEHVLATEAAGGPVEPHRDLVTSSREVPIWEAVAETVDGDATWHLLVAHRWRKDNRILPAGWTQDHPQYEEIAPRGIGGDPNFEGGSDTVSYRLEGVPDGALDLRVTLLYQSISTRAVQELLLHEALQEVNAFRQYWEAGDRSPETVDDVRIEIGR